jgi:membrane protein DedA with SNARE-associated domain
MLIFYFTISIMSVLTGASTSMQSLIATHGYVAIIALMALESASLPIPSEVVLPVVGLYVYNGTLNIYLAVLSTVIGTLIGITVDYYVAYFLGKDVVYSHAKRFHIKKESIDHFDKWFNNNAGFTVFVARLIPVVRGLISFPAGFAQMDLKKFYLYSLAGSLVWNVALIGFGYYTLGSTNNNLTLILAGVGLFAQALYIIYHVSMGKIKENNMAMEKKQRGH